MPSGPARPSHTQGIASNLVLLLGIKLQWQQQQQRDFFFGNVDVQ